MKMCLWFAGIGTVLALVALAGWLFLPKSNFGTHIMYPSIPASFAVFFLAIAAVEKFCPKPPSQ